MLQTSKQRLVININDLRQYSREMATGLLQRPLEWIPPMEAALREAAMSDSMTLGFEGSFGDLHTTPRYLGARHLGRMVCLEGIVTSCSLVRPKMLRSVHYNEASKQFVMREYFDATMITGITSGSNSYPAGNDGERLTSQFGLSQYRDYQTISMQEMPEKAPAGQLPRSVDVCLDGPDLVDSVKPGDRIQLYGTYKCLTSAAGGGLVPAAFRAVIVANNVQRIGGVSNSSTSTLSQDDLHNVRAVARRPDLFDLLSRSLAPSIYGHEWIKRAILLQLLGGVEHQLEGGAGGHIRGDINILLVGDPSTAKSQMLRFVLGLAPLAIATTGRGSSGVGLTAAVTVDKETGERRLEAGAMVLADRGVICIDEFDKMSDLDRVAIHEVMEQQTVTIAKAGIHASLNARCSVLAAANPIWGQYRETASPQDNIRLPDSLLSRFDLLFIVLDSHSDPEHDRRISEHVLRMHRYCPPGLPEGAPITIESIGGAAAAEDDEETEDLEDRVFQRHYAHTAHTAADKDEVEDEREILALPFVKKYIYYAKSRLSPVLTKAASEYIVTAYTEFRQKHDQSAEAAASGGVSTTAKTFPVTPRTLETLIRLATAHAKARLSSRVERRDAMVAQELLQYCLYKEVLGKARKPRKVSRKVQEDTEDDDDEDHDEDNDNQSEKPLLIPIQPAMEMLHLDSAEQDSINDDSLGTNFASQSLTMTGDVEAPVPASWAAAVHTAIHLLRQADTEAITLQRIRSMIHQKVDTAVGAVITDSQIEAVLAEMQKANQIMYVEGVVYPI